MMPLHDRDVNTGGRSSKSSNLSVGSRSLPKPPPSAVIKTDMLATAPGVMSMLKSSTELGTESLVMPGSRFSAQKRNSNRQSGTASRLSTGSSRSQQSRPRSGQHGHHAWPSISSGGRRMSMTSNYSNIAAAQHYLDTMPPPSLGNLSDPASLPPPAPCFRDNARSMSLTNSIHQRAGGLANYRSLSSLRGHEPYPRPRSPYRYPTRLKRPGYRPASPAMSDVTIGRANHHHHRPSSGLRMAHGTHGSQSSFRSHGPLPVPHVRPPQMYHGTRDRSSPSTASFGPLDYMLGMYPPSLPASRQGTPSIPEHTLPMMTPTHSVAAKSTPQSSDAPSSTPPTPRNQPALSVTEPTIVINGHTTARRGSSASATMPTYYDYSEQFEPASKETTHLLTGAFATPPSLGFVQRIRTILEERRTPETQTTGDMAVAVDSLAVDPPEHVDEVHELPASPIIKRITRELIKSHLLPTSEVDLTATTTITTTLKSTVDSPSSVVCEPPTMAVPKLGSILITNPIHERIQSKASAHISTRSNSTTATAAMDYALRYSPPPQNGDEDNDGGTTMSDFLANYNDDERHMTTVVEEPTEAATIVKMAEVEVTAPTPTAVARWKPSFETPPEMMRTQSLAVASSVYSSGEDREGSSSRHSTPLVPSHWPPPLPVSNLAVERAGQVASMQPPSMAADANVVGIKEDMPPLPSRPVSALSRASRLDAVMPTSRPPSAAGRALRSETANFPSRPPSANDRVLRLESSALHSRPPSAAERYSKQYQVILPPRPPSSLGRAVRTDHEAGPSRPVSTLQKEPGQSIDLVESPVSPLSEVNVGHFDPIAASPVTPLLSPELAINKRDSNVSSIWSYRKPLPKRPDSPASISTRASIREPELAADLGGDRESTTDLRFSALGFRPTARQLDDVKEEPSLETSTVDLRASTFKFPLPQRKSSLAHYEEFRLSQESKRKASLEQGKVAAIIKPDAVAEPRSQKTQDPPLRVPDGVPTLSDLHAIPSLHFSRVDLFAKLNEALDLDAAPATKDQSDDTDEPSAEQESTGVMRVKYRSFFESLDNMASDPAALPQPDVRNEMKTSEKKSKTPRPRKNVKLPKIQQWTADDLMAEIDRLSIPSINGLTQRLSELLPSLRRYYGEGGDAMGEDETVRSALDEIRRLGAELIPELRDSGSFMEEDSDELYEDTSACSSSEQESNESTVKLKHRPRSASTPGDMSFTIAELDGTPAVPRSRSMSHSDAANQRDSLAATDQSRASRRSVVGSPPESRPWNLDTSYPWANNIPSIDISLPAPSLRHDHVKHRPSRLRLHDDALEAAGFTTQITAASVCSDITETTAGRTYSRTTTHRRRTSKRSLLGSLSRKIGLPKDSSIDNSGYATGPDILRGVDDRTVDPGDRYPTTGLSPPSALNIDEVRSFFSDDSSHFETQTTSRGGGLRKRFSNLKTRLPPMSRTHSALEQRPAIVGGGPTPRRSNSLFFAPKAKSTGVSMGAAEFDPQQLVDETAAGMPKTEVRAKKLVNRMKTLWYRGGELLRSLSGKRRPRESLDWDDSGESAVWSGGVI